MEYDEFVNTSVLDGQSGLQQRDRKDIAAGIKQADALRRMYALVDRVRGNEDKISLTMTITQIFGPSEKFGSNDLKIRGTITTIKKGSTDVGPAYSVKPQISVNCAAGMGAAADADLVEAVKNPARIESKLMYLLAFLGTMRSNAASSQWKLKNEPIKWLTDLADTVFKPMSDEDFATKFVELTLPAYSHDQSVFTRSEVIEFLHGFRLEHVIPFKLEDVETAKGKPKRIRKTPLPMAESDVLGGPVANLRTSSTLFNAFFRALHCGKKYAAMPAKFVVGQESELLKLRKARAQTIENTPSWLDGKIFVKNVAGVDGIKTMDEILKLPDIFGGGTGMEAVDVQFGVMISPFSLVEVPVAPVVSDAMAISTDPGQESEQALPQPVATIKKIQFRVFPYYLMSFLQITSPAMSRAVRYAERADSLTAVLPDPKMLIVDPVTGVAKEEFRSLTCLIAAPDMQLIPASHFSRTDVVRLPMDVSPKFIGAKALDTGGFPTMFAVSNARGVASSIRIVQPCPKTNDGKGEKGPYIVTLNKFRTKLYDLDFASGHDAISEAFGFAPSDPAWAVHANNLITYGKVIVDINVTKDKTSSLVLSKSADGGVELWTELDQIATQQFSQYDVTTEFLGQTAEAVPVDYRVFRFPDRQQAMFAVNKIFQTPGNRADLPINGFIKKIYVDMPAFLKDFAFPINAKAARIVYEHCDDDKLAVPRPSNADFTIVNGSTWKEFPANADQYEFFFLPSPARFSGSYFPLSRTTVTAEYTKAQKYEDIKAVCSFFMENPPQYESDFQEHDHPSVEDMCAKIPGASNPTRKETCVRMIDFFKVKQSDASCMTFGLLFAVTKAAFNADPREEYAKFRRRNVARPRVAAPPMQAPVPPVPVQHVAAPAPVPANGLTAEEEEEILREAEAEDENKEEGQGTGHKRTSDEAGFSDDTPSPKKRATEDDDDAVHSDYSNHQNNDGGDDDDMMPVEN